MFSSHNLIPNVLERIDLHRIREDKQSLIRDLLLYLEISLFPTNVLFPTKKESRFRNNIPFQELSFQQHQQLLSKTNVARHGRDISHLNRKNIASQTRDGNKFAPFFAVPCHFSSSLPCVKRNSWLPFSLPVRLNTRFYLLTTGIRF
ncbi:hypothetical protein AVEN_204796-1 [Araneus ventricosus]|uniref:Uncharacterized protein n=1 Tax=Araneus ventricosus TaxID=182803 RepID=A0A4Y2UZ09_ARAVE|nr:hypothetical protein AVEN_105920-1 [Araneus ventricosus]GBO16860.1 hypothetical protein AVEN_204796-1 [Araneus ventricosus]